MDTQEGAKLLSAGPKTLSWDQPKEKDAKKPEEKKPAAPQTPKESGSKGQPKNERSSSFKIAAGFVAGLLLGSLITWSWFDLRPQAAPESGHSSSIPAASEGPAQAAGSSAAASSGQAASNDSLTVPSPQTAGQSVDISNLSLAAPAWAVVYEDIDGNPGRALGAARFDNSATHGTVPLLRMTLPNLTYFVGLVEDTPDHSFSVKANQPLVDNTGSRILAQFVAQ